MQSISILIILNRITKDEALFSDEISLHQTPDLNQQLNFLWPLQWLEIGEKRQNKRRRGRRGKIYQVLIFPLDNFPQD